MQLAPLAGYRGIFKGGHANTAAGQQFETCGSTEKAPYAVRTCRQRRFQKTDVREARGARVGVRISRDAEWMIGDEKCGDNWEELLVVTLVAGYGRPRAL